MRKSINVIIDDSLDGKRCPAEHVDCLSQFRNLEVMTSARQFFTQLRKSEGDWNHSAVGVVCFEASVDLSLNGHFSQSSFHQFLTDTWKNRLWLRLGVFAAWLAPTGENSGRDRH